MSIDLQIRAGDLVPHLFSPIKIRDLTLKNRIVFAPMSQYMSDSEGMMTDWHLVHYVTRAIGGAGLVMVESTSVESRGRTEVVNPGLFDDRHIAPMKKIVDLCHQSEAHIGIQIGHSGRKARRKTKGQPSGIHTEPLVSASAIPFDTDWAAPQALTVEQIAVLVASFRNAAKRALTAGYDVLELHGAHGYLINQFISPVTNHRDDEYGGSASNRMRFPLEIVRAVRTVWPDHKPLFFRVSATDCAPGGNEIEDTVEVARSLSENGVDLIDCSSGGVVAGAEGWPLEYPGFQVVHAERIRRDVNVLTSAVGLISAPEFADEIIRNARADLVMLGREMLRNPYWALHAAEALGYAIKWPSPYRNARPVGTLIPLDPSPGS